MPPKTSRTSFVNSGSVVAASALAFVGTAAALWVNHRARVAEREHPPTGQFIEIEGVRLHYLEQGTGPPVVLLHGNGVQSEDFIASGLFDKLAQRHRVIAFDRPGFGYSDRPRGRIWTPRLQALLLSKAINQLSAMRPVVVAHSWGTLVALAMGLQTPAEIGALVLLSGYYHPTARLDAPLNIPGAIPGVGDVLQHTALPVLARIGLKRALRKMFAPAQIPENFFSVIPRELMLRPKQLRAAAEDTALMIPAVTLMRSEYSRLRPPVVLFAGTDDGIVDSGAQTVRLHKEVAGSQLHMVPTGHMLHYAAVNEIANAVASLSEDPVSSSELLSVAQEVEGNPIDS